MSVQEAAKSSMAAEWLRGSGAAEGPTEIGPQVVVTVIAHKWRLRLSNHTNRATFHLLSTARDMVCRLKTDVPRVLRNRK